MTDEPFALFLTWTTYGSWPPGDARGHVSNTFFEGGAHQRSEYRPRENRPGRAYSGGKAETRRRARALQSHETTFLTPETAIAAAESLTESCAIQDWRLTRGAVLHNHVHIVVTGCPDDGPGVRRTLKGRSQAALSRACGVRKWWTTGGSDRYLHSERSIAGAIRYTADQPGALAEIVDGVVLPPTDDGNMKRAGGLVPPDPDAPPTKPR
ncbi:hypothetical protein [Alienimonas chondri]|nr:hypothetical protein [Alienimonas chondri]